jgi:hypothetical protein
VKHTLTPQNRKRLRAIYEELGFSDEELIRQAKAAQKEKPPRGRKPIDDGTFRLLVLEVLLRTHYPGINRTAALRELVQEMEIPGQSESSTIARLSRKLQDPEFRRIVRKRVKVVKHYPRPRESQI